MQRFVHRYSIICIQFPFVQETKKLEIFFSVKTNELVSPIKRGSQYDLTGSSDCE